GIRDFHVTGVQTCALPISPRRRTPPRSARSRSVAIARRGELPPTGPTPPPTPRGRGLPHCRRRGVSKGWRTAPDFSGPSVPDVLAVCGPVRTGGGHGVGATGGPRWPPHPPAVATRARRRVAPSVGARSSPRVRPCRARRHLGTGTVIPAG